MPKATVTVRELKNKDSGVDLAVTSYRELPGLVRSTFEYQIVVVSSLSCFKLPSHKDSDVVQFTLFKKFSEFEELRVRLSEEFSGTALPPIVKKSIIVNDAVIKERRNSLDAFMKFLAATPRIVQCCVVLTFLGVEPQRARRFASGETDEKGGPEKESEEKGENADDSQQGGMGRSSSNLFEDDEEEDEGGDDFLASAGGKEEDEDDFFSEAKPASAAGAQMFESPDLKRELTVDDEKDFSFIPDAIITKREVVAAKGDDDDDDENDDLLNVEEDIDLEKILTLDGSGKKEKQQAEQISPEAAEKPQAAQKPSVPARPKPAPKPTNRPEIPEKPTSKPTVPVRPKPRSPKSEEKPPVVRPTPAPRKLKPQAKSQPESSENSATSSKGDDMSTDDIMQYIAANTADDDTDLDLFS